MPLGPELELTMCFTNGNGWKAPTVKVMPPLLVTTGVPVVPAGPRMVMVLPETVAVKPFAPILDATLEATVFLLFDELEVPVIVSTPFTLMLDTVVLPLPFTLMEAVGPVLSAMLHSV